MRANGQRTRIRAGGAAALLGVALLVAACGSSSSSSHAAAAGGAPASSGGVTIGTAKGPQGTYLTGGSGRALYLWVADTGGKSSCSGACATTWPPLTTDGKPTASAGVNSADLGTISRSDGTTQVTYMGHPLYYYAPDSSAGMTTGQGSNSFGAKWWLVSPAGSGITQQSSSAGSSQSSSGGSGGSSGGASGGYSSGGSSSGGSSSGGSSSGGSSSGGSSSGGSGGGWG